MAGWSDGYFTDIQYTGHYYPELAPGFMAFACLRQGVRPPPLGAGASYLELGCGQGYGLNLLAAANPAMTFWGVDFHPGQIDNANRQVRAAGLANIAFDDLSFEQMLGRDLPRFDVVALHGIYSWVSPENRAAVVQILDRVLKPGGMVYVSYNCLPGWAPIIPLQRFIADHVARSSGSPEQRIVGALRAALDLLQGGAGYFSSVPWLKTRIENALKEKPAYLVHEYLNAHSHPFFHADVVRELEGARLTFAASANIADDLVNLAAPAALQPLIQQTQDPVWREALLDYAGDRPFRRDIFVRGRNGLSLRERDALLAEMRFALLVAPEAATFEFQIPIGNMKGAPGVYQPIVDALAQGPRSYRELAALPDLAGAKEGVLLQAITLLVGSRQIHPVAAGDPDPAPAAAFNRALTGRLDFDELPAFLAASAVGTGVRAAFEDLVAVAAVMGGETDDRAAHRGWEIMARTGRRLVKDGQTLLDQTANETELAARIAAFRRNRLPALRALGVL